ncbi:MAG: IclR family transcriptional regulator, partial [Halodesulfurarchaeum sp.]
GTGRTHETTNTSLRVLEAVSDLNGPTVSELADELGMAISTAHKHLQTLRENGLVVKREDRYRLGLKLFHLGTRAKRRDTQFMLAREKTYEIADRTSEVVNFSVLENGRAITLFDSLDTGTLEGFQRGQYFYLHSTAAGKAMLAEMNERQVDAIIEQWGLPERTEFTITDRETLAEELELVRKRGYAVNEQEAWENLKAVAVPVRDSDGEVLGAMDISGPPHRISYERSIARTLSQGVEELERALDSHTVLESHWNVR